MLPFKTIDDVDLKNKQVILRAPFDIELNQNNQLKSTERIDVVIPTINKLIEGQCSIVIITSVGRPQGSVVDSLTTQPHAIYSSQKINQEVQYLNFAETQNFIDEPNLEPGKIVMLENIRFFPQEEASDQTFADQLAKMGEICVFEAFPQAHRKAASTTELIKRVPTVAGYYFRDEYQALLELRNEPRHPFACIFGGVKVRDKIPALLGLASSCDKIVVGGIVAQVLHKIQGGSIGRSSLGDSTDETFSSAKQLKKTFGEKLVIPTDFVVLTNDHYATKQTADIGTDDLIVDLGPQSSVSITKIVNNSQQILVGGSLGKCSNEFDSGSMLALGKAFMANPQAKIAVAGGDTTAAFKNLVPDLKIDYEILSGGAALEFLATGTLPVLEILKKWNS